MLDIEFGCMSEMNQVQCALSVWHILGNLATDIKINNFEEFRIPKPKSGFSNWRDNYLNNFSLNNFVDTNNEKASNTEFESEHLLDNLTGVECTVLSGDQDPDKSQCALM